MDAASASQFGKFIGFSLTASLVILPVVVVADLVTRVVWRKALLPSGLTIAIWLVLALSIELVILIRLLHLMPYL